MTRTNAARDRTLGPMTSEPAKGGTAAAVTTDLVDLALRVPAVRDSTREETVRRIRRAVAAIETDITRQLDLHRLAAIACMGRHHFLRRFKNITGETPHQFILRRRIARGRELLLTSELSAAEICRSAAVLPTLRPSLWRSGPGTACRRRPGAVPHVSVDRLTQGARSSPRMSS
ncbi:MAG: helix-turn-helix transcriptional regulator, partial [Rhodospirillales bacterium]|nr:helix-turn-helix transcriptional regulator [Rhodospirillales bacterium]